MNTLTSMTFSDYQKRRGVSWTSLSAMGTSALLYHHRQRNPIVPTPIMILGTAIHAKTLEPELFDSSYVKWEGGSKQTNAYKAFKAEATDAGLIVLGESEWEQVEGAAWAINKARQGREARRIMRGCKREPSLFWKDPITGIMLKARPDLVSRTREHDGTLGPWVLADLKTTTTVDERKFGRTAGDMLYHCKMAFARMGCEAIFGNSPHRVTIIAVEQSAPHDVGTFDICEGDLDRSETQVHKLLGQLKTCRKRRTWPGRCENTQLLNLGPWLFPDYMNDEIEVISR